MAKSRSARRRNRKRWAPLATLAVGAIVVAGLVTAAFARQPGAVEAVSPPSSTQSETPDTQDEAAVDVTPTSEAVARLKDGDQGWTLTVVGDSTGNDGDEWVWISARELSNRLNRPVDIHTWNTTTVAYDAPARVGEGSNAAITIWNAASPGSEPQYALDNLAAITANASDMLIVNHGHNFVTPGGGTQRVGSIIEKTAATWANRPAVAVVIQNPRTTEGSKQEANLTALRAAFEGTYTLIDVEAAWRGKDITTLLRDGTHPNEAGSALWADAAKTALGW